jgi:hypothetical protein
MLEIHNPFAIRGWISFSLAGKANRHYRIANSDQIVFAFRKRRPISAPM